MRRSRQTINISTSYSRLERLSPFFPTFQDYDSCYPTSATIKAATPKYSKHGRRDRYSGGATFRPQSFLATPVCVEANSKSWAEGASTFDVCPVSGYHQSF